MTIYLDNASTSWPKPEPVYREIDNFLRYNGASPGRGGHSLAREAGLMVYVARERLAELFHVPDPSRISFAINATDAINTALFGILKPGDTVVTTAMEHNAVARPLTWLERSGIQVKVARCDQTGRLDLADMERLIQAGPQAVIMTHASNVTGTLMPVTETGRLCRRQGSILIVDAAQTAGVEDIDVEKMNIDVLTFSGHKGLLGPQGTGGLYVKHGVDIKPARFGGTGSRSESTDQPDFMPDMLESGTVNTPGIAGLAAGVGFILATGITAIRQKEVELSNRLREGLSQIAGVSVKGPDKSDERTSVVSFTTGILDSAQFSYQLDQEYGIICRGGLQCAPWAHRTIGTLATGVVRLSPGYFTTEEEIEKTLQAIHALIVREENR